MCRFVPTNVFQSKAAILLVASIFSVATHVAAQLVPASFGLPRDFAAGDQPASVAAADFNGDGIPDLAVADLSPTNTKSGRISILIGRGSGTYDAPVHYDTGFSPTGIAAGNLNADGKIDLVVANSKSDTVSVFLGNGDGTFQSPMSYPTSRGPSAVVLADMNGDGQLDAVVSLADPQGTQSGVAVLLGKGDGTFRSAISTTIAAASPFSLRVADFNGDGKPDVVLANLESPIVLLGEGDGTFESPQSYPAGNGTNSIDVADLNGDGKLDLLTADTYDHKIWILLGNGDGTFGPATSYSDNSFPVNEPTSAVAGDFNGDGKMDVAISNQTEPAAISVLLGDGKGGFRVESKQFAVGLTPFGLVAVDLNGDGKLDLVTVNSASDSVSVLLGTGDGGFVEPRLVPSLTNSLLCGPALADTNRDGNLDLITTGLEDSELLVYPGNGDGTFGSAIKSALFGGCYAIAMGDLNGDGIADVVVATNETQIAVELGNGDGTFRVAGYFDLPSGALALTLADMNGDGKLDVVTANEQSGSASVLLGNGDGTLQAAISYPVVQYAGSVAVADLNGDGFPDVVIGTTQANEISILFGNGNGTLQTPVEIKTPSQYFPGAVAVGDFNGDGNPDIAALSSYYGKGYVAIYNGVGAGAFAPPVYYNLPTTEGWIHAVDLNGDGKLDLAVVQGQDLEVLLNKGDGTFVLGTSYWGTGISPDGFAIGDVNGDGKPDVATANISTLTVLLNTTK